MRIFFTVNAKIFDPPIVNTGRAIPSIPTSSCLIRKWVAYDCGISPIANLYVTVGGSGGGEKSVVNVFPVPASDQLSIQVVQDATDLEPATNQAFSFVLYNSMQLIVKSGDGANGVWDGSISDLPNGIYYLHVSTGQEILKKQLFVSN